jgi:hypothetical protein
MAANYGASLDFLGCRFERRMAMGNYTSLTKTISRTWQDTTNLSGVASASLLVVLVVSTGIGAMTGLALGGRMAPALLAIIAGFLGTVVAGIVRNTLLVRAWGIAGIEDAGTPVTVVIYAAVASLAGSLAADRIALLVGQLPSVVVGGLAGLLSSVLLGLLMLTYRMTPYRPTDR